MDSFNDLTQVINESIAKHPPKSVYTITNIENIKWFDPLIKDAMASYMNNNSPYIKYGAVIGLDGVNRLIVNMVIKMTARKNMYLAFSRKQAIEWLLAQE